eukprot:scaffold832_cov75-Skeletonema_dohrnii-CCMP3373.AAC.12
MTSPMTSRLHWSSTRANHNPTNTSHTYKLEEKASTSFTHNRLDSVKTNSRNIMSEDTTNTAKSGLDVLFTAIDQQSSNETTSSLTPPTSSTSSKQPITPNQNPAERVSVNPFRSKMDPRMRKSIEARVLNLNPNMMDEEAVLAGFVFPERGTSADAKWIGEDNVSMRQRKVNFRRSWKRFNSKQNNIKSHHRSRR